MENFWRFKSLIKFIDGWGGVAIGIALIALCFYYFLTKKSKKKRLITLIIGFIIAIPTMLNANIDFGDKILIPDVDEQFYHFAKEAVDDTDSFLDNEITLQELVNKLEATDDNLSNRYKELRQADQDEKDIQSVFLNLLYGVVQVYNEYDSTSDIKSVDLNAENIDFITDYRNQLNSFLGLD